MVLAEQYLPIIWQCLQVGFKIALDLFGLIFLRLFDIAKIHVMHDQRWLILDAVLSLYSFG